MNSYENDKASALKMSTEESLRFYLEERMAGGFDEEWLKPEAKAAFDEAEGFLVDDEEFPEELLSRWENIKGGIYL